VNYHLPKPQAVHPYSSWPSHSVQVGWQRTHWFFSKNCPLGQDRIGDLAWIKPRQHNDKVNSVRPAFIVRDVLQRIYSPYTHSHTLIQWSGSVLHCQMTTSV